MKAIKVGVVAATVAIVIQAMSASPQQAPTVSLQQRAESHNRRMVNIAFEQGKEQTLLRMIEPGHRNYRGRNQCHQYINRGFGRGPVDLDEDAQQRWRNYFADYCTG